MATDSPTTTDAPPPPPPPPPPDTSTQEKASSLDGRGVSGGGGPDATRRENVDDSGPDTGTQDQQTGSADVADQRADSLAAHTDAPGPPDKAAALDRAPEDRQLSHEGPSSAPEQRQPAELSDRSPSPTVEPSAQDKAGMLDGDPSSREPQNADQQSSARNQEPQGLEPPGSGLEPTPEFQSHLDDRKAAMEERSSDGAGPSIDPLSRSEEGVESEPAVRTEQGNEFRPAVQPEAGPDIRNATDAPDASTAPGMRGAPEASAPAARVEQPDGQDPVDVRNDSESLTAPDSSSVRDRPQPSRQESVDEAPSPTIVNDGTVHENDPTGSPLSVEADPDPTTSTDGETAEDLLPDPGTPGTDGTDGPESSDGRDGDADHESDDRDIPWGGEPEVTGPADGVDGVKADAVPRKPYNGLTAGEYSGGTAYKNRSEPKLPETTEDGTPIRYKEYDRDPYDGVQRNGRRFVVGDDDAHYYTDDHYQSWVRFR
ncbi:Guanine-specific ribonuclease N1 and T1 (modular protein) [Parafrankia sp. Ea1.12]|nr:Guanine-specific ribonuclease N1 and T1 (modular protein) [Parafrankia sp. Ea1.12]